MQWHRARLTPACRLHLADLYNRPVVDAATRASFVAKEYLKTTAARMARVLPAFGAGGVLNKKIRKFAHAVRASVYGYAPTSLEGGGSGTTLV